MEEKCQVSINSEKKLNLFVMLIEQSGKYDRDTATGLVQLTFKLIAIKLNLLKLTYYSLLGLGIWYGYTEI